MAARRRRNRPADRTDDSGVAVRYKSTPMDEISRDVPPDVTDVPPTPERTKGPEEAAVFERGRTSEDLVVSDRRTEPRESDPTRRVLPRAENAAASDVPAVPRDDVIAPEVAAAAVAAEAEAVEIEEEIAGGDEEGLPAVPELADARAVARVVYVLMLTSREGLSLFRLAQACNTTQKLVEEALALLQEDLRGLGMPVELARTGDIVKWMSGPDTFPYLQRLRGVKKMEKLSPAALETLAVIAYRQPVMRSEIEAIRGVKAGPMLRTLLQHRLVRVTGRADVPGRPLQYGTTQQFLERFGLGSLQELPSVKEWKSLG